MSNLKEKAILTIILSIVIPIIAQPNLVHEAKAVSIIGPVSLGINGGENGIAVNPNNASNAVVFDILASSSRIAMYTKDGGATWHPGTSTTAVPGGQSDPDVTVDYSGNFYVSGFSNATSS